MRVILVVAAIACLPVHQNPPLLLAPGPRYELALASVPWVHPDSGQKVGITADDTIMQFLDHRELLGTAR